MTRQLSVGYRATRALGDDASADTFLILVYTPRPPGDLPPTVRCSDGRTGWDRTAAAKVRTQRGDSTPR